MGTPPGHICKRTIDYGTLDAGGVLLYNAVSI
jgi:hypothetical protein